MKNRVNRYAIFAERVHLMNGGPKSFRDSAPTEEAAMKLAEEVVKSKKAEFYLCPQMLDFVVGVYNEFSVKRAGS
ncbi:hypothetical protein ACJJID_02410 [Microbulbifer sp. CnH-101-G]|uniref:hypothetical protein n=1 Tax=Microbulbifer sp. CnH-101-G TaxID=3243393 RepID=UPI004039911B